MAKKLPLLALLALASAIAAPLHADTVTALDPYNSGPVPTSPFTLVSLGSSTSPENQLVSTGTIGPTGGETISFGSGSGVYAGSITDVAASPVLNSNSYYLVGQPGGTGVTIAFSSAQTSFDLLWGSIDTGQNGVLNELTFYDGSTDIAHVTGSNVAAALSGDSSFISGTTNAYVEIAGLPDFTSVVASDPGSGSAFEFIPGADAPAATSEPNTLGMLAVGLAGLAAMFTIGSKRRKDAAAA